MEKTSLIGDHVLANKTAYASVSMMVRDWGADTGVRPYRFIECRPFATGRFVNRACVRDHAGRLA